MGKILELQNLRDNFPPVLRGSTTSLTMASTHIGSPTRIKIGVLSYQASGLITLNTGTSGFNGIDTGSFAAGVIYNIFAVVQSGALGMVISTATAPTGFTFYKFLGKMISTSSTTVSHVMNVGEQFVEYVSNNGTDPGGGNTRSSATTFHGEAGSPILAVTSNANSSATVFECSFLQAAISTDIIEVEYRIDATVNFIRVSEYNVGYRTQNTSHQGIGLRRVSSDATKFGAHFGGAGASGANAAYGTSNGDPWSNLAGSGALWRIRKVSKAVIYAP